MNLIEKLKNQYGEERVYQAIQPLYQYTNEEGEDIYSINAPYNDKPLWTNLSPDEQQDLLTQCILIRHSDDILLQTVLDCPDGLGLECP
jgi:hypothetical protein